MKFLLKKYNMEKTLLVELINKQLEPHGKTYEEVRDKQDWFMNYVTTKQQQNKFTDWAVYHLVEKLKISTKKAEEEVSWFILQYGLPLDKEQVSL